MRGLSDAVVAIILVIASVTVALVVVNFTYGLFGTLTYKSVITSLGNAYVKYNPSNGEVEVCLTVKNTGPEEPAIMSVSLNNVPVSVSSFTDVYNGNTVSGSTVSIQPGTNSLTIEGYVTVQLQPGSTVSLQLTLNNGVVLVVPATIEAQ